MPFNTPNAGGRKPLLRDEIYQRLSDAILDGTLEPGKNLKDDELVEMLGVSRAPIREALQQLREIGLVEMAPNRYTRVAPIEIGFVSATINLMLVYYELAVRTAVPKLGEADLDDLDSLREDLRDSVSGGDISAFTPTLYEYFLRYAVASGNVVLQRSMDRITPHLRRSMTPREGLISPAEILEYVDRVHAAAHAGNADEAAQVVHDLAAPSRAYFLKHGRASVRNPGQ